MLLSFLKKRWYWFLLIFLILGALVFFSSAYYRSLRAYNLLAFSAYQEPICHEECFLYRRKLRQKINQYYPRFSLDKKVKRDLFSENQNLVFRFELLLLLKERGETPDYLVQIMEKEDVSLELKSRLLNYFQIPGFNLAEDLEALILSSTDPQQQSRTLASLQALGGDRYFDLYRSFLSATSSLSLYNSAVIALSSLEEEEKYFNLEFIKDLETYLYSTDFSPKRKRDLVYLLYQASRFSSLAKNILTQASGDIRLDKYTRYFSAGVLDRPQEEVLEQEWEDFQDFN